jgi:glycosyltransferase involved in cell wall biosynthesis
MIAYLANSVVPSRTANSINVMKMCAALARLGHHVTLYVPDRGPREPAVDVFRFYGVDNSFRMDIRPWRRIRGRSFIFALSAATAARRAGAGLVYTRLVPAAWSASLLGLDAVLELHAPPERTAGRLLGRLARSRRLLRVVCISVALGERIALDHPRLRDRIMIAHDGADDPGVPVRATLPAGDARIEAGYAGHLYAGKGMEIISGLARRCPWARFHVVGGMTADIDRWKRELDDVTNVVFHGFVPHGDVARYLSAMDVLLAPYQQRVSPHGGESDIGKWMSPLKLFEYMAVGRPIICSDLPTLREVLEHGVTALLCDPASLDSWADALLRLADNPAARTALASRARAAFEENYSWSARARRIIDGLGH